MQEGSGSDVAPNDVSYATAVVACWKGDSTYMCCTYIHCRFLKREQKRCGKTKRSHSDTFP
jgi:hypothetical protein